MKKIISTLALTILIVINIQAQTNQDMNSGPVIKFDKMVHDYGTIYQGGDGNCTFTFTNTGKQPLVLSSVRSSCGCTVPNWPQEPILPGKSNTIKVTYDSNRLGQINKQVTVQSNASEPTMVLNIKGTVIEKPAELMPEKQLNVGTSPISK